jgi:hypothetical protein
MAMVKAENLKLLDVDGYHYAVFDDGSLDDKLQDWLLLDRQLIESPTGEEPAGWEPVNLYLGSHGLLVIEPEVVHLFDLDIKEEQRVERADLPAPS